LRRVCPSLPAKPTNCLFNEISSLRTDEGQALAGTRRTSAALVLAASVTLASIGAARSATTCRALPVLEDGM
jgi:hypothetical protein